mgnify:CR=1 FL=1
MKKVLNLIKKNIFGIIIGGLIFGSVGVYAATKFYASDVSVNAPTGSSLGSNATLQNALDDLYSKINNYAKLYSNGTAIYYNPTTGEKCTPSFAVSTTGTKSGCMKWYTFNDEEGSTSVNLILDHNTTAVVAYNSSGSNSEMSEVAKALSNDTKDWKIAARLIKVEEIALITGNIKFNNSWFYFDSNNQTESAKSPGSSKYAWLYNNTSGCLNNGCQIADENLYNGCNIWGYWTSTPINSNETWIVDRYGGINKHYVYDTYSGVRPVITISKSILN